MHDFVLMNYNYCWFWIEVQLKLKYPIFHFCREQTIGEFASIADKSVVSRIFKSGMHKLLKVTEMSKIPKVLVLWK